MVRCLVAEPFPGCPITGVWWPHRRKEGPSRDRSPPPPLAAPPEASAQTPPSCNRLPKDVSVNVYVSVEWEGGGEGKNWMGLKICTASYRLITIRVV